MAGACSLPKSIAAPLLVVVELPDGELSETGKGILAKGGMLSQLLGGGWSVASFAPPDPAVFDGFTPYGVPELTVIDAPPAVTDSMPAQGKLIAQAASNAGAKVIILPHNDLGCSLAPLLANDLNAAIFTEVVGFDICEKGLKLKRQALGTRIVESKIWNGEMPLVITVAIKTLSTVVLRPIDYPAPKISKMSVAVDALPKSPRIIERIPPDPQTVDVSEAEVIFCAGKGHDKAAFDQLLELTKLLNVTLGVTRPVYDYGWVGFERMVGQTGKTIAPRFYLGIGISGSMHHVGGIKDSRKIVAINIDPKAPMFANSDEAIVADLKELMPRLIKRVRAITGGAR
jgi:electron transfer flavoprotein alpha subunit